MITIKPAAELQAGDVFSTDGYTVSTVVLLPGTSRVFVQTRRRDDTKTAALPQDFPCPLWTPDEGECPGGCGGLLPDGCGCEAP